MARFRHPGFNAPGTDGQAKGFGCARQPVFAVFGAAFC